MGLFSKKKTTVPKSSAPKESKREGNRFNRRKNEALERSRLNKLVSKAAKCKKLESDARAKGLEDRIKKNREKKIARLAILESRGELTRRERRNHNLFALELVEIKKRARKLRVM